MKTLKVDTMLTKLCYTLSLQETKKMKNLSQPMKEGKFFNNL